MSVYLCLPAFNEELSIRPLFQRIINMNNSYADPSKRIKVVLYDDGSTDGTVAAAETFASDLDLVIIKNETNYGLGVAVRSLMQYFTTQATKDDVAVVMDCDDTHDPSQIPEMLLALNQCDVVIASRYRRGSATSGVPFHRLFVSFGFMLLVKAVLPIKGVRDYSCGYRGYSSDILTRVSNLTDAKFVEESGFAAMPELLWNCARAGAVMGEIPMNLSYERKLSDSKMDVNDNTKRLLKLIFRLRRNGGSKIHE
jgi:dolichol-phosphate mannosyltransferase